MNSVRDMIIKELSNPRRHIMFKGWANQEEILDELEVGYVGFRVA